MLRVYRAPATEPGRTTLQADALTWPMIITAMRSRRDQAMIDAAGRVQQAVSLAGDGAVLRVRLSDADARAVLDVVN